MNEAGQIIWFTDYLKSRYNAPRPEVKGGTMRMWTILLATALAVVGCASDRQIAQNTADSDDAACRSYGAQPGTQEYFQCRMAKDQQRQQTNAALASPILSRPQPQPYYLPMPGR